MHVKWKIMHTFTSKDYQYQYQYQLSLKRLINYSVKMVTLALFGTQCSFLLSFFLYITHCRLIVKLYTDRV